MGAAFFLSILTPERVVFEGDVSYVSLPGVAGYMGVLVDHAPLLSSLRPGRFEIRRPGPLPPIFFSTRQDGFLEISKNRVSVLLDAADSSVLLPS